MVNKIDNNQYADEELFEVKIAYPQLYYSISTGYHRFDGHIEIDGKNYNYVKRRFANDTLYLLCLPNKIHNKLSFAKHQHIASNTELPGQKKNAGSFAKCFSFDYYPVLQKFELYDWEPSFITHHPYYIDKQETTLIFSCYNPPEETA